MLTELTTDATPIRDRRRTPRVRLVSPLRGHIPSLDMAVTMIECGDGGFSIQSNEPLPIGSVHTLNFTTADNHQIEMRARVAHSLRAGTAKLPLFFMGFAKI